MRARVLDLLERFQHPDPDSLGTVELVMELETSFQLSVPDKVAKRIRNLDEFLNWLRRQL